MLTARRATHGLLALVLALMALAQTTTPAAASWPQNPEAPSTETEPNNTSATANDIALGAPNYMQATISAVTDIDWFRFNATQGQSYVVESFNVAGSINTSGYRLYIHVYDPNGTKVEEDINGTPGGRGNANSGVQVDASISGVYTIRVFIENSGGGSGPYNLRVLPSFDQPQATWDANHEPNNWRIHAAPITVGSLNAVNTNIEQRLSAYRTYYPDEDWFRFDSIQGQTYVVETFNVAGAINTYNRRTYIRVYDNNNSLVASNSSGDSGSWGNANGGVQFQATTGGAYFIHIYIEDFQAGYGPYSLRVLPRYDQAGAAWDANHEPNNWANHSFRLNIGRTNTKETNIEARSPSYGTFRPDTDWFRFDATAGQTYVLEIFNAAKAINTSNYPVYIQVFDSNGSKIAEDTNDGKGSGNTSSSVEFQATVGGTYAVAVFPEDFNAGSGPYSIRVLPKYDQPEANWDAAMEPNNHVATSYPLDLSACERTTSIIPRNAAYLTNNQDYDWFVFTTQKDKQYTFEVTHTVSQFGFYGLELILFDKNLSKIKELQFNARTVANFTANYDGVYYAYVYPYDREASGPYKARVFESLTQACGPNGVPVRAVIDGNISSGSDPNTGEVSLVGRGGTPVTISALAPCPNGQVAQNVTLIIGSASVPMTRLSGDTFTASISLPTGVTTANMSIRYICGSETLSRTLGIVILIDPSGKILDVNSGQPIKGAAVTLYRLPNALPDTPTQTRDCRITSTRGGNTWDNVPAAALVASQRADPLGEALAGLTPTISPAVISQTTGTDGRYAWDVVEGCWYVHVTAPGYKSKVSALVGVPPAVLDLDIRLTPGADSKLVYVPFTRK